MLDEAVLIFDAQGSILSANHAMHQLLAVPDGAESLLGKDVNTIFMDGTHPQGASPQLPFQPNAAATLLTARRYDGSQIPVVTRCQRFDAYGTAQGAVVDGKQDNGSGAVVDGPATRNGSGKPSYILCVHYAGDVPSAATSNTRLLSELRQANERLRGILEIISTSTLDIESFGEFNDRVCNQLQGVFAAHAVGLYLYEGPGFRLRGSSTGYAHLGLQQTFMPQGYGVTSMVARERRSLRLQLVTPARGNEGAVMADLDSGLHFRVQSQLVNRVSTLVATPVFSFDRVMAVILVCWKSPVVIEDSSVQLLETMADYLSMEFATAVSQFQQSRRLMLAQMTDNIRELIYSHDTMNHALAADITREINAVVPSHAVILTDNPWTRTVSAQALDGNFLQGDLQLPGSGTSPETPGQAADDKTAGPGPVSGSTALALPYSEGIGFPLTFDELFSLDGTFLTFGPSDSVGAWVIAHSGYESGLVIRLSSERTKGEMPQYALMLLRSHLEPPHDEMELEYCRKIADVLRRSLDSERERTTDTHIAQALQRGLQNKLPKAPGITTASQYLSATAMAVIGGDFYDQYTLPDNRVVLIIGDVSGKGVESAAMAALVKTALAAYAWDGLEPAEIAASVNNMVTNFSRADAFASLLIMSVNTATQTVDYCSAGHPPAMIVRNPTGGHAQLELLSIQSPVIGALPDLSYEAGAFSYQPGDMMFLYTDGTTEARSPSGDFFGEELLRESVLRAARGGVSGMPEAVLSDITQFAQGSLHDDIAMVAVRFDALDER